MNFDNADVTSDDAVSRMFIYMSTLDVATLCQTGDEFVDMTRNIQSMKTFIARVMEHNSLRLEQNTDVMDILTVTLPRYIQSFYTVNADWQERMRAVFHPHAYLQSSGITATIECDLWSNKETGRPDDYGMNTSTYVTNWKEFNDLFPEIDITDVVKPVADILNAITVLNEESITATNKLYYSWIDSHPDSLRHPDSRPSATVLLRVIRVHVRYGSQRPVVLLGDFNFDAFKSDCVKHLSGYMFTPVDGSCEYTSIVQEDNMDLDYSYEEDHLGAYGI